MSTAAHDVLELRPPAGAAAVPALSRLERRLLNEFQRDLPLCPEPFAAVAEALGCDEDEVIEALRRLHRAGLVSRVGPVFRPRRLGVSTLAAMAVPAARLEEVAALVSAYPEVNHNYEREHEINLWFVVTAPARPRLEEVLAQIGARSRLEVLSFPLERAFHIDLGFALW